YAVEISQKAKIRWSIEGDENSKYFHGIMNKKRSQLAIRGTLANMEWISKRHRVKNDFFTHFKKQFSPIQAPSICFDFTFLTRLSSDQVQDLEHTVTYEEVKMVVWDCGTNKSPGPDGFSFQFYRKYWTTIDDDVFQAVRDFFVNGHFSRGYETLKAFGSGSKWRNWISSCLNNAMGSVLVNGSPTLEFQFHKGLKQVFIGERNNNNIQTLLSVLRCFYLASGLKIDLHKSKLMGIGVSSNVVADVASLIGCSILTAPFNYLGVK
nr:RNA-directed DNA polymerase, eukaryota [Tanacetum cinerariifolium]